MSDDTITKAELARTLGVSKARVSQLIVKGLPVLLNGRVKRAVALNWIEQHASSANGSTMATTARSAKARAAGAKDLPPHFAFVRAIEKPADRGAALAAMQLAYRAPAMAASLAASAGAPMKVVFALFEAMVGAMSSETCGILRSMACEPLASDKDAPIWERDALVEIDWPSLAKDRGEPFEMGEWKAHLAATFGGAK